MRLRCIYLWICAQSAMSFLAQSRHPECPLPIDEMNIISFVCATMTMIIEIERERERKNISPFIDWLNVLPALLLSCTAQNGAYGKKAENILRFPTYTTYILSTARYLCVYHLWALLHWCMEISLVQLAQSIYVRWWFLGGNGRYDRSNADCRLPIVWRYFIPDGLRWLAIGKMRN